MPDQTTSSSASQAMTPAQMAAMMTPAMQAMMTPAHKAAMQAMAQDWTTKAQSTTARLPTDAAGRSFTRNTACTVQQPPMTGATPLPPTLVNKTVSVVSTSGERVKVRFADGTERDFHKSELGVQ